MKDVDDYWIRVSVQFPGHPKVGGLSDPAFRLLVTTWCYARSNTTDGVIPSWWAQQHPQEAMTELLDAHLLEPHPSGFCVHDYLDWQESAAEIETNRSRRSAAGQKAANARWGKRNAYESDANRMPNGYESQCDSDAIVMLEKEKEIKEPPPSPPHANRIRNASSGKVVALRPHIPQGALAAVARIEGQLAGDAATGANAWRLLDFVGHEFDRLVRGQDMASAIGLVLWYVQTTLGRELTESETGGIGGLVVRFGRLALQAFDEATSADPTNLVRYAKSVAERLYREAP